MATDGSVHAAAAMLTAARLLGGKDAEVDVVCVGPDAKALGEYERHFVAPARKIVEDAQRLLAQRSLRTKGLVESGSPADKLLGLLPEYDLTVVGAYGNHDRIQPGLGPVTSRLLQMGRGNLLIGRELVNERNFRVLVALDTSEACSVALKTLPAMFDAASLEVTLIHIAETSWAEPLSGTAQEEAIDSSELDEYQHQLARELRRAGNEAIEGALRDLGRWSIPANAIVREGDPALEITSEADQGGYDLVLAGATGASDVKHALLGSVSLKLAWDCPCSVAIIRQPVL
jgi:nucleotide-binding universal stress UspA family protein